jgi:uncharacterized protein YqgC (DUF456 family)
MNHFGLEILMFIISLIAVLLGVLGLPGNLVPVAAALIAVLAGDGSFTWGWFILFLIIAISGEIADQLTGIAGSKKFGASRPGMIGAAIGGFAGGVLGTLILPVIGSLAGVFAGCFILTFVSECIFSSRSVSKSGRSGLVALVGRVLGTAYKFTAGFILLILMVWRFWGAGT